MLDFRNANHKNIENIKLAWNMTRETVYYYIIKICFLNSKYDRSVHFDDYLKVGVEDNEITNNKFFELHTYSVGSSSIIHFVYLIEKDEICLMTRFLINSEKEKLFQREHENYLNIKHPLHPRYFGTTTYLSYNCIMIF